MKRLLVALLSMCVIGIASGAEPAPGKQVEMELKVDGKTIPYLLYLPEDYGRKEGKWPFMLFLHGRGESDGPLSVVAKWGPPRVVNRGEKLPFIIASPQCPRAESWPQPGQQALLVALMDHLQKTFKVDTNRTYLTGLSMGGYGSWRLAADHPDRFAAVVPICGGGSPADAPKLAPLPIWVFHGTEDKTVPLQRSTEMVEAIKAAGGQQIIYTTLEGISHNSWEAAYATPELYTWMLKHSRSPAK